MESPYFPVNQAGFASEPLVFHLEKIGKATAVGGMLLRL